MDLDEIDEWMRDADLGKQFYTDTEQRVFTNISPPPPPTHTQEYDMNTPIVATRTYFKNVDISTMSSERLINAIKDLNSERSDLERLGVTSEKVSTRIEEINAAIILIVSTLDAI